MVQKKSVSLDKILIYLTGGVHWVGGVQYTRNLVRAIAQLPDSERPKVVLSIGGKNAGAGFEQEFTQFPNVVIDGPLTAQDRTGLLGLKLLRRISNKLFGRELTPKFLRSDDCTVAFPAKAPDLPGPSEKVFWVPDFQYKNFPEYFSAEERSARDKMYDRMFSQDAILVLSSQAVQSDHQKFFPGYAALRIRVLHFHTVLSDEDYTPDPQAVCEGYGLPPIYAYLPNQIWQHKGHDTVLTALAKLRAKNLKIPIVCTGSSSDYRTDGYFKSLRQFIQENDLEGQVTTLGLIPRQDQIQIFRQASLVIQPSRSEGWSTVVEDARALGKDIILSDIAVHWEQRPEHGRFFKTGDAESLAEQLEQVWPTCVPGVQPEREQAAKQQSQNNNLKYAREFMNIMQEAHGLHLQKAKTER